MENTNLFRQFEYSFHEIFLTKNKKEIPLTVKKMFRGRLFDKWKQYDPEGLDDSEDSPKITEFRFNMLAGSERFLKDIPTSPNGKKIDVIQFRKWCRLDISIARLLADHENEPLLIILNDCHTNKDQQCSQEAAQYLFHFETKQWIIFSCGSELSTLQKQMIPIILTDYFNQ